VVDQRTDAKWQELDRILDDPLMKQANGARRKLVLFSEFKDTLMDLCNELDRRWADHLQNPTAAVPWEQVCGLLDRDRSGQETSWW
jgi:hypothetical protein